MVQIIVYAGLSVYTPGSIVIYGGIMLLAVLIRQTVPTLMPKASTD